ncbi:MAG: aspartate kinase [Candidatus Thermoplasmatota archaeon]|nr:aspartate kinase [Candidatus Thermoplasmatota archaeon]
MRDVVVMKFGGSCLRNSDGIRQLVNIVSKEERAVVVVSALSGVTDRILDTVTGHLSEKRIESVISFLRERHISLLSEVSSQNACSEGRRAVDRLLRHMERLLYGVYYTRELTPRTRATLLSFGERLSSHIVASALSTAGLPSRVFEADSLGIVTDTDYENATADLQATRKLAGRKLSAVISKGITPVITGFFGRDRSYNITLLGRNGTDYSASIIAYAINSTRLVIWKDVDGFLTADPSLVPGAKLIDEISYDEAAELSYFGAEVLHPKAVDPARMGNIGIRIMNIANASSQGTLITSSKKETIGVVKSVSCLKNLSILRVYVTGGGYTSGTISGISGYLGRAGVGIISATTSQTCIAFLLRTEDIVRSSDALAPLVSHGLDKVETEKGVALLCAVGEGLGRTRGIAARVFGAIASAGVNVGMMSAGASTAAYHFTVSMRDLETAARAVHTVFFGG